jgi:predicted O-linked N-acetylglucosamine transferase (SPINDLY family)
MNVSVAEQAEREYEQVLQWHQQGQLEQARAGYERVLQLHPAHAPSLNMLGILALQTNDPRSAVELIGKSLQIDPEDPVAYVNHASACTQLNLQEAAIASYDKAMSLEPDFAPLCLYSRGNALTQLQRFEAAVASYDEAIALGSDYDADAYYARGIALQSLRQPAAAAGSFERALALDCSYAAEAHFGRGVALQDLQEFTAAAASFEAAIAIKPDYADAHKGRAVARQSLGEYEASIADLNRVIALVPGDAEAYNNRGIALAATRRFAPAIADFDRAITLQPRFADALRNRGVCYVELRRYADAVDSFDRALESDPSIVGLAGMRFAAKAQICDWRDLDADQSALCAAIERGEPAISPFNVLAMSGSAALQRRSAENWGRAYFRGSARLPPVGSMPPREKIRIGYFSADFREHATMYLMAGLFEQHDRTRFEVTAFAFGPESRDAMFARLQAACSQVVDLRSKSNLEAAELARSLQIDIAVDLNGYAHNARPGIFAHRVAPLQVGYLGYPGTMGVDYIDYLVADRTLIPAGNENDYSEKIIFLPHSYQVNDSRRVISDRHYARTELGLPSTGMVFCSFNNSYKIKPAVFTVWMNVLRRVHGSVLWLLADNPDAAVALRGEATRRGIDPDRLVFAERMPLPLHLARHRAADLFLDTLPCAAHTTASDALWAGLPVLTCIEESFASRVAASLLKAVGLPGLVTDDLREYEELAVALAHDADRLAGLRRELAQNRNTSPLFDTARTTRHLESAYATIAARSRAGLPPDSFAVEA